MKRIHIHLILPGLLACIGTLPAQTTPEAAELTALRESWRKARDAATRPIDEKYRTALTTLKEKLTKAGDLDRALQVDGELRKLAGDPTATGIMPGPATHLFGTWSNKYGDLTIKPDHTAQSTAHSGKWEIKAGYLVITWATGWTHRYSLKQRDGELDGSEISPSGQRSGLKCIRVSKP